jgi:hypothetical protein
MRPTIRAQTNAGPCMAPGIAAIISDTLPVGPAHRVTRGARIAATTTPAAPHAALRGGIV